jgi:integrase
MLGSVLLFNRAGEIAGVPHLLRHSPRHAYAMLQHRRVADMVLLSRLLGNAIPTVTQNIYVDPFPEEVRMTGETSKIDMSQEGAIKGQPAVFWGAHRKRLR